jgi:hypothetical protein
VCGMRGVSFSFYSPPRVVPGWGKYGNSGHRLLEDQDDLPTKIEPARKASRFGQTWGSTDPRWSLPSSAFLLLAGMWALVMILDDSCLDAPICSTRWALLS